MTGVAGAGLGGAGEGDENWLNCVLLRIAAVCRTDWRAFFYYPARMRSKG